MRGIPTKPLVALVAIGMLALAGCSDDSGGSGVAANSPPASQYAPSASSSDGYGDGGGTTSDQGGYPPRPNYEEGYGQPSSGQDAANGQADPNAGGDVGFGYGNASADPTASDPAAVDDPAAQNAANPGADAYGYGYGYSNQQGGYNQSGQPQGDSSGYGYGYGYQNQSGYAQQGADTGAQQAGAYPPSDTNAGYPPAGDGNSGYPPAGAAAAPPGPVLPPDRANGYGQNGYGQDGYAATGAAQGYGSSASGAGYDGYPPAGTVDGAYAPAAQEPPQPKTWAEIARERFRQGKEGEAFRYVYARALAQDEGRRELGSNFGWVAGLKRPAMAVRWGIGVRYSSQGNYRGEPKPIGVEQEVGSSSTGAYGGRGYRGGDTYGYGSGAADDSAADDESTWDPGRNDRTRLLVYGGEVAEKILDRLEARLQRGYFGEVLKEPVLERSDSGGQTGAVDAADGYGPQPSDGYATAYSAPSSGSYGYPPQGNYGATDASSTQQVDATPAEPGQLLPGVIMVGVGDQNELLERATRECLDVLLILDVSTSYNVRNGIVQNNTRLRLLDVQKGEQTFVMRRVLNNMKVQMDRRHETSEDPVDTELDTVFEFIDQRYQMGEIPSAIQPEHALNRVAYLAKVKPGDPLAVMAEMAMYHQRRLIDEKQLAAGLAAVAGQDVAKALVRGEEAERMGALEPWLVVNRADQAGPSAAEPDTPGPASTDLKPL